MQHHSIAFSFVTEVATEKVLQFILPLKSVYSRNFGFAEQKCNFEHCGKVKSRKKDQQNDIIFVINHLLCFPFQSCPL
jgi:hypothetical protein